MSSVIVWLNAIAEAWANWLWPICWQAALVIALAWTLTLLLHRSSPWLRSWVWRVAYLKLLLLIVWPTSIDLPLLPSDTLASSTGAPRTQRAELLAPDERTTDVASQLRPPGAPRLASDANAPQELGQTVAPGDVVAIPDSPMPRSATLTIAAWLFVVWLGGLLLVLTRLIQEVWRTLRFICSARRKERRDIASLLDELRERLGVWQTVSIATSTIAEGPMLVGFIRPMILVPQKLIDGLSDRDLRLALAHELAHVKRHDLTWNFLSSIVHVVLYFHPLAWLAHRQAREQQEQACDELVIDRLGTTSQDYGQMLLKVIEQISPTARPGFAAVGISGTYRNISRRLIAMSKLRGLSKRQLIVTGGLLAVIATVALVPWRIVAKEPTASSSTAKTVAEPVVPPGLGPEGLPAAAEPQRPKPPIATNSTPMEQLLVGTWILADSQGELTFNSDGTFQSYDKQKPRAEPNGSSRYSRMVGRWEIAIEPDAKAVLRLAPGQSPSLWDDQVEFPPKPSVPLGHFGTVYVPLLKLDRTFLRLNDGRRGPATSFYRRADLETEAKDYDRSIPVDIRTIAAFARLTPEETANLLEWCMLKEIDAAQLNLIAQVIAARHRQISLPELFKLSPEESTAYRALNELTGGSFQVARRLAEQRQLAPEELGAVKKLQRVESEFHKGYELLIAQRRLDRNGGAPLQLIDKLQEPLTQLRSWLMANAFTF